ncbi:MAG: hypothetical protein GTO18_05525 [Anaerolineales bacterium]|nr:hypothetical protein [Anaerolineales bacterium]
MTLDNTSHDQDLQKIIESARRLGVELDEAAALQWLTSITAAREEDIKIDERTGIFGHRITLLDFSDEDLAHFRKMGKLVEFEDIPGKVETALALSGSSAQSKIQTYPGDADFFERVNIIADTKEEACNILGDLIRQKALDTMDGENYKLIEVKMGSFPTNVVRDGDLMKIGSPISWYPDDIEAGMILVVGPDGRPTEITWEGAAQDPGWCKLDWVVADPLRKELVNASNMLDATWEAPDGSITPLDGYLDSFFQEVYLDAESIPIFSKLVKHVSGDALDDYVEQLEKEVRKYVTGSPNYGKAAKRMYNVFRLTGRYAEAAYIRELFDEPTTMLYQVWSLLRTIDESFQPDSEISAETIVNQTDKLILGVIETLEGEQEVEITRLLLRLKDLLTKDAQRGELSPQTEAARAEVINIVNNFFHDKLTGVPTIHEYIQDMQQ